MKKVTNDLKPDVILKTYWRHNERFADLFNAVLFGGKPFIRPDELEDVDTEESSILENKKYAASIQASRDNIKIRKRSAVHGVEYVLLGNESQRHIHYAMPMRVMGYDYSTYKKQYDDKAQKYKRTGGLNRDEYLSGMRKTDKLMPVITIVVYYGDQPWDGATTLHGMLDIPEEVGKYVNDYKMLLVEARKNNLLLHNVNNKDLFNLLEIILDKSVPKKEAKQRAIQYDEEHKPDKSVVMTVAGATNSKIDYHSYEKGEVSVSTLFDEIAKEGEKRGVKRGEKRGVKRGEKRGRAIEIVETGNEFHLSENDIMERLQRKLNITPQQAQTYLTMYRNGNLYNTKKITNEDISQ